MKRLLILMLVVFSFTLCASAALAATPGYGARAMGMGGAYTAIADDGSGPYWNPAGAAQRFLVVTPGLGLAGSVSDAWTLLNTEEFPPDFTDMNLRLKLNGGVILHGIGLNAYVDVDGDTTETTGNANGIGALVLTGAFKINKRFLVGANAKLLYGQKYCFSLADSYSTTSDGSGYGFDAGFMFKPIGNLVRVGFAARDLGVINWTETTTPYVFNIGTGEFVAGTPNVTENSEFLIPSYTLGVSVQPPLLGLVAAVEAELKDGKVLFRAGVEQSLLLIAFRAGAFTMEDTTDLGYSAGAGLKLGPIQADLALVKGDEWQAYLSAGVKL